VELSDQVAIVTGAGQGIGKAAALALAAACAACGTRRGIGAPEDGTLPAQAVLCSTANLNR
jgi:NAD(P)-dependent dehydrogenase (short-subunit alcohol dehydrogenase family)